MLLAIQLLVICWLQMTPSIGEGQQPSARQSTVPKNSATKKVAPTQSPSKKTLNVEDVTAMIQAGLSEDLIAAKIKKEGQVFDLTPDQMISLKKSGASDRLIKVMLDPSLDYEPPARPTEAPKATAPSQPPIETAPRVTGVSEPPRVDKDPIASTVPQQAGLYYLSNSSLLKIDLKTMASAKVAGRLGSVATLGIKSRKTNGYLIGPKAKSRVKETSPVFYVRLPEGLSIDEVVLVTMYVKSDRRELEVGSQGGIVGGKQGLRMEVMKPFDSKELAPQLYKISTSILGSGEYLFYLTGSGDSIKGIQGKGYDFGVE
jgi:hypothetical protein